MGGSHGDPSWPLAEALIRLGSGEGVCAESRPVSTEGHHHLPFILPLPTSLFHTPSIRGLTAFPHSSDKMSGREEEEEGRKVEGAAVAQGSWGALGKAHHWSPDKRISLPHVCQTKPICFSSVPLIWAWQLGVSCGGPATEWWGGKRKRKNMPFVSHTLLFGKLAVPFCSSITCSIRHRWQNFSKANRWTWSWAYKVNELFPKEFIISLTWSLSTATHDLCHLKELKRVIAWLHYESWEKAGE